MANWRTEHPHAKVPEVFDGNLFDDISWHNDAHPSFQYTRTYKDTENYHIVFVDYEDEKLSQFSFWHPNQPYERYHVALFIRGDFNKPELWSGNSLDELLAFLETLQPIH